MGKMVVENLPYQIIFTILKTPPIRNVYANPSIIIEP